jgi:two-component sensor histidine kinase/heme exporter protein D
MSPARAAVPNPLSLRLLRRLVLISALLVLAMSIVHAVWERHDVLAEIDRSLSEIARMQAKPLANSLWDYDRKQAGLLLEAICSTPLVRYAAVQERGQIFAEYGDRRGANLMERAIPLEYQRGDRSLAIGTLLIQTDLDQARERVVHATLRALALHAVLVVLLCGALFLLTRNMISRHLAAAATHFRDTGSVAPDADLPELRLDKKDAGDELDLLARSVNEMQENRTCAARRITAAEQEIRSQALFPEVNPNPVLRISAEGVIATANAASRDLLAALDCAPDRRAPEPYLRIVQDALASGQVRNFEVAVLDRVFAFAARPLPAEGFVNLYGMDITMRVRAEEEVRRTMHRLQCLVRVLQKTTGSAQEYLDYCLHEALALSGSRLGYICRYDEAHREFMLNSWSREALRECAVATKPQIFRLDEAGVWGEVVRRRVPIVINDFRADNPLKRGCPEGHVRLERFMSVPVLRGDSVVAVAGVANRADAYEEGDVLGLSLLMDACWQVVGRMNAEQGVRNSLHEKEILLKEIHHRVKNNMQVISSLLFLQMQHVESDYDRDLFAESQKRIQAMALVHEELYGSADLSSVDMREYIPRLVERVASGAAAPITVDCRVDEVRLPVTRSIPCGLLLNELVMNAVKHAFRGREDGRLLVRLAREDGRLALCVEDDGPGLPPDFDLNASETLGMTLVVSLAAQLGGRVAAENSSPGARFCLHFPDAET